MNHYQPPLSTDPCDSEPLYFNPSSPRSFAFFRALVLLLTAYSLVFWYLTEDVFDWGARIASWRREYFDDNGIPRGSMKFRGPDARLIYGLTIPWSLLVYPAALLAGMLQLRLSIKEPKPAQKIFSLLCAIAMAAILARFVYLGVFECVTSGF
ncbi:hypothetical protein [Prosthecobacter sp.]|uniref:hypothetical protein n=1 Tax=Prosthecobacter sp. TaxID=1965333 RepID=UPI00378312D4